MTTASFRHQGSTISAEEVEGFDKIAGEWWDEHGKFAPLHRLNPTRIGYIREMAVAHFSQGKSASGQSATPMANLSLLDVGCGGGLICEPMARLGASVTGIDAGKEAIDVAAKHAEAGGLHIDYRVAAAEELAAGPERFDVVLALEIIEHVADTGLFYDALARLVKPGGLLIVSTLNRTAKSFALGIVGAEYILRWVPRGTHSWQQFIKPSEMANDLIKRYFSISDTTGIVFHPTRWSFSLDPKDLDVNYLLTAVKSY